MVISLLDAHHFDWAYGAHASYLSCCQHAYTEDSRAEQRVFALGAQPTRRYMKCVGLTMIQVVDSVLKPRRFDRMLKVGERGRENIVVVVVDRDGQVGIDDPHRLHALCAV